MNKLKKIIAVGATASMVLWSLGAALPVGAVTIADGDLVKTASSSAVYYIQGAYKRVFPHYNVYLSWGYPADFSTVKTVSASELAAYTDANAMPFRDGSLFRGTASSLGGKDKTAVFYVEGAKLRPVISEAVYQALFKDSSWAKVTWVPDDLLSKFNYDMGTNVESSSTHPNGSLVKYSGTSQIYLIEGGKKRAVSSAAFTANRYDSADVLTIDSGETYADGSAVTGVESGLLTPGWSGISAAAALTASLYNSPAGATVPNKATNVPVLRFKLTAGSSAATVTGLTFKRTDLGAAADWDTLYVYEGNDCITPNGRSLSSDDHTVEFAALSISIPANSSKILELRGDLKTAGATANSRHAFQMTEAETSATVSGLPLTGNVMVVGSVNVTTAILSDGVAPVDPSVGAQDAEIANFWIEANGDNDITFSQVVFTFTGTMSRGDITNLNLYLLGETASLASASSIASNDTFTLTLNSPYVITKGQTKNFVLKADLAGEVGRTLKMYVEETYHLAVRDNEYDFGAAITNGFDTGDAAELTLQGGEITMTDNGPLAANIAQNQQDVVLTNVAITADRNVEVRKLFVTLGTDVADGANDSDDISDLRIKDADTGQTLMTPTTAVGTTLADDYLMTGTFNLTANTTRNLAITVDVGVDADDSLDGKYVSADLKIVDRSNDTIATGAEDEEAQMRDSSTGDWILTADIIPIEVTGEHQTIQTPALTMAVASTPVSGLTAIKGASKVDGIGIVFTAGDASAISIRQFSVRVYVNTAATFAAGTEDNSPTGEATTVYLYDDANGNLLASKTLSVTAAAHDYGAATFSGLNVSVPAGENKKLVVKFDVSSSLAAARYVAIGVAEDSVTAYDSASSSVTATDNDADTDGINFYTDADHVPTHYAYLDTGGTLTMAQDSSTPDSDVILAGATDVVMSKIKFTATKEDWTVNKLRVELATTANESSISKVKISYPGGSDIGTLSGGYVKFTGLNWKIEKDTEEILTISVDLAAINQDIATTGRDLKIGLDCSTAADDCEAVGTSSTVKGDANGELSDVDGNSMYLRKSRPTVAMAALPSSSLIDGTKVINKFTVTADAAGAITMKKFSWNINVSDNSGADLSLTSWKLYDTGNPTALAGFWSNGTTTSTAGTVPLTKGASALIVELDDEIEIAAGATKTFELKATVAGSAQYDSVSSSLFNDIADTAVRTGGLADHATQGVQLEDSIPVDFLWSDKARGANHTDSYQTTYDDWTNGYLIKVLPTDTVSLVYP